MLSLFFTVQFANGKKYATSKQKKTIIHIIMENNELKHIFTGLESRSKTTLINAILFEAENAINEHFEITMNIKMSFLGNK